MESREAACASVRADQENGPSKIPESGWAGRANFSRPALKTLRNPAAPADQGEQERKCDAEN
jgi:hypothetical protein